MEAARKNMSTETEMISIVDDDESMRSAMKTLIESIGLSVEAFPSAKDFLNSGRAQLSACLILDLRMPGMSGLELQRRLTAGGCPLPIIFVTAHYSETERAKAMEAGAVGFLSKPFTEKDLFSAISLSLAKYRDFADYGAWDADQTSAGKRGEDTCGSFN
jgi:FixJ family two-component response regulator